MANSVLVIDDDTKLRKLLNEYLEENGFQVFSLEDGSEALKTIEEVSPDIVILELGGNDGLRGFPTARMKENLSTIIETSQASGAAVVLLGIRIPSNYGQRYTAAFENVYRELADEYGIPWIEFFMEGIALNAELMQDDGIHPNSEAQPILLDNAWPIVNQALAQRNENKQ